MNDAALARAQWRQVADQLRPRVPKLDQAEADVLAYMSFPLTHRPKLHSTNPIECLNSEIKRRTDVVGMFPHEDAITRLDAPRTTRSLCPRAAAAVEIDAASPGVPG